MDVSSKKTKALRPGEHLDGGSEMSARPALILLADDNADLRADVKRLLGGRYTVEAVADGQAALVAARARVPDLVLTGELMSGLNGFGLLRELRSDPRTKTVPMIFLSASDDEDSRVAGLEAGADDYLVKPFSARELLARVRTTLEMTRGRHETEEQLRASKERYRTLFESIDEGFCVCEMLFDENGKPVDYRFLEVNPVFEKMTGLEQAAGRTAGELVPNLEEKWFEIYGRVVLTGEPVRFENGSEVMNRWFDVSAFRVGQPENRKFAILFKDITERKNLEKERERFLAVGSPATCPAPATSPAPPTYPSRASSMKPTASSRARRRCANYSSGPASRRTTPSCPTATSASRPACSTSSRACSATTRTSTTAHSKSGARGKTYPSKASRR